MLKVGNEDVKKIMMGNVEIENIAIGDETIPVESGTPAEPKYYIQISGGTKQALSGNTYEGFIDTYLNMKFYLDNEDITSGCTSDGSMYLDNDWIYTTNPLQDISIGIVSGDYYLSGNMADLYVEIENGDEGIYDSYQMSYDYGNYNYVTEDIIPANTTFRFFSIDANGNNRYYDIHYYDQSEEQESNVGTGITIDYCLDATTNIDCAFYDDMGITCVFFTQPQEGYECGGAPGDFWLYYNDGSDYHNEQLTATTGYMSINAAPNTAFAIIEGGPFGEGGQPIYVNYYNTACDSNDWNISYVVAGNDPVTDVDYEWTDDGGGNYFWNIVFFDDAGCSGEPEP